MQKFMALFFVPAATMKGWMENTDEATRKEQMETMMSEWNTWKEAHKDSLLDQDVPLGKTKRVTKDGVADIVNDLNYSMMVQAESHEAAAQLFVDNPHLKMIPDSYVDIMTTTGPTSA